MAAILVQTHYNAEGYIISRVQKTLPDSLDWKGIYEKEIYVRYMGGMPPYTKFALIESQGETKLISDLEPEATTDIDLETYRRRQDGSEAYLNARCAELGIDRTRKPRNQ